MGVLSQPDIYCSQLWAETKGEIHTFTSFLFNKGMEKYLIGAKNSFQ